MVERPVMGCGHSAQGATEGGAPVCVICAPSPEAYVVASVVPVLVGREARCTCGVCVPSRVGLAFFKVCDSEFDSFYCGCRGWD